MDRASDSGSEGWGFESLPAYQGKIIRTLSQQGKGFGLFLYLGLEQKMQIRIWHQLVKGSDLLFIDDNEFFLFLRKLRQSPCFRIAKTGAS